MELTNDGRGRGGVENCLKIDDIILEQPLMQQPHQCDHFSHSPKGADITGSWL